MKRSCFFIMCLSFRQCTSFLGTRIVFRERKSHTREFSLRLLWHLHDSSELPSFFLWWRALLLMALRFKVPRNRQAVAVPGGAQ
jgi:hypothetical protein